MAVIRFIDGDALDVKENGEQIAAKARREGQLIRLTELDEFGASPVWVNVSAIAQFVGQKEDERAGETTHQIG